MSNYHKFAVVFLVVNLHSLRGLSFVLYVSIYAVVVSLVLVDFIVRIRDDTRSSRWGLVMAWVLVALMGFGSSLATISVAGAILGLSRFLFALPVLLALYVYTESLEDLARHIRTFVVFFALASLTLPLQLVIGPVSWFADATQRAGIERFSSLIGSLTSIGIAVGCYMLLALVWSRSTRSIWIFVIAASAVMSLSKAAIANVAIAFAIILFVNRKHAGRLLVGVGSVSFSAALLYAYVPSVRDRVEAVLVSFGIQNSAIENYDVSVVQSMFDRMVSLPLANLEVLGQLGSPLVYLAGGGFGMAETALVSSEDSLAPMAHNQFVELLSVFGLLGGSILIGAMVLILIRLVRLHRAVRSNVTLAICWAYILFFGNSFMANGTVYQPASASIFYLSMFTAVMGPTLAVCAQKSAVARRIDTFES